jgi:hypothetical protein
MFEANCRNFAVHVTDRQKHGDKNHRTSLGSSRVGTLMFLLYTAKTSRTIRTKKIIPLENKVVLRKPPTVFHNNSLNNNNNNNNIVNGSGAGIA